MLNITEKTVDNVLSMALEGRLDTTTAPQLEEKLNANLSGVKELVLDCAGLEYISSAGLRVLLSAQKVMSRQGSMKLTHVNMIITEIFEVTGFIDVLTIE